MYEDLTPPWVTLWENEWKRQTGDDPPRHTMTFDGAELLVPADLEQPDPAVRGRAKWAHVSTSRWIAALNGRCQVCGCHLDLEVMDFLIAAGTVPRIRRGDMILAADAPVCQECIPISMRSCPHIIEHEGTNFARAHVKAVARSEGSWVAASPSGHPRDCRWMAIDDAINHGLIVHQVRPVLLIQEVIGQEER